MVLSPILMVFPVRKTIETPLLQFFDKVDDVLGVRVVQVPLYLAATCTLFGVRLRSTGC